MEKEPEHKKSESMKQKQASKDISNQVPQARINLDSLMMLQQKRAQFQNSQHQMTFSIGNTVKYAPNLQTHQPQLSNCNESFLSESASMMNDLDTGH